MSDVRYLNKNSNIIANENINNRQQIPGVVEAAINTVLDDSTDVTTASDAITTNTSSSRKKNMVKRNKQYRIECDKDEIIIPINMFTTKYRCVNNPNSSSFLFAADKTSQGGRKTIDNERIKVLGCTCQQNLRINDNPIRMMVAVSCSENKNKKYNAMFRVINEHQITEVLNHFVLAPLQSEVTTEETSQFNEEENNNNVVQAPSQSTITTNDVTTDETLVLNQEENNNSIFSAVKDNNKENNSTSATNEVTTEETLPISQEENNNSVLSTVQDNNENKSNLLDNSTTIQQYTEQNMNINIDTSTSSEHTNNEIVNVCVTDNNSSTIENSTTIEECTEQNVNINIVISRSNEPVINNEIINVCAIDNNSNECTNVDIVDVDAAVLDEMLINNLQAYELDEDTTLNETENVSYRNASLSNVKDEFFSGTEDASFSEADDDSFREDQHEPFEVEYDPYSSDEDKREVIPLDTPQAKARVKRENDDEIPEAKQRRINLINRDGENKEIIFKQQFMLTDIEHKSSQGWYESIVLLEDIKGTTRYSYEDSTFPIEPSKNFDEQMQLFIEEIMPIKCVVCNGDYHGPNDFFAIYSKCQNKKHPFCHTCFHNKCVKEFTHSRTKGPERIEFFEGCTMCRVHDGVWRNAKYYPGNKRWFVGKILPDGVNILAFHQKMWKPEDIEPDAIQYNNYIVNAYLLSALLKNVGWVDHPIRQKYPLNNEQNSKLIIAYKEANDVFKCKLCEKLKKKIGKCHLKLCYDDCDYVFCRDCFITAITNEETKKHYHYTDGFLHCKTCKTTSRAIFSETGLFVSSNDRNSLLTKMRKQKFYFE